MTIRDEEGDILAGRHLNVGEDIAIGRSFIIDVFHIEVLECVQVSSEDEEQAVIVDLTEDVDGTKPTQRFGGCFWILANEDEDEVDLPGTSARPSSSLGLVTYIPVPKPTVSSKKSFC